MKPPTARSLALDVLLQSRRGEAFVSEALDLHSAEKPERGYVQVLVSWADWDSGVSHNVEVYLDDEDAAVDLVNHLTNVTGTYAEANCWDSYHRTYTVPAMHESEKEMYVG